ncbi:hypothetical protein [Streptomyces sp. BH105]|uniref:hypothetical protein n=1 Tax=Streptomyces sp. BH105 TaxID=3410408 RepID=UPI003CE74DD4
MTQRVEPGQIWADIDPRRAGRKIRITDVKANFAFATVVQNTYEVQGKIDTYGFGAAQDRRGTTTRIGLARFFDEKYRLCDSTELQAMSVANAVNIARLPSSCTDLAAHRWVPVAVIPERTPAFHFAKEPAAHRAVAVCPKCWTHTEFDSPRVPSPPTYKDLAA